MSVIYIKKNTTYYLNAIIHYIEFNINISTAMSDGYHTLKKWNAFLNGDPT